MAVDDALVRSSPATAVLRVYGWRRPTISLGFHQKLAELDLDKCRRAGVDVVRRPTGGRAIFHSDEVTYSVAIPRHHELHELPALEIYNRISSALVAGLRLLNIEPNLHRTASVGDSANYTSEFACFARSAEFEVQVDCRKLVGSAQRRFKAGLLQHGSIMLSDDHLRLMDFISAGSACMTRSSEFLQESTISLEALLNRIVSYDEVVACLQLGFKNTLGVRFEGTPLRDKELQLVNGLEPKYSNPGRSHS